MGNTLSFDEEPTTLSLGSKGSLIGLKLSDPQTGKPLVCSYRSIPYALPPTGENRFKLPRHLPEGHIYGDGKGGPRDSTMFAPFAPQPPDYTAGPFGGVPDPTIEYSEENCLNLNIWVPADDSLRPPSGWPVFVWIHGGWLQMGNPAADLMHSPVSLITQAPLNAIFLAVGYRLSVFGFLASQALVDEAQGGPVGNYGMWDQRLALEWVQENVSLFGGDKESVTICGRSAGAYSVHSQAVHDFLMVKGEKKGVFKQMVMYSNAIPCDPKPISAVENQYLSLLTALKISHSLSSSDQLKALRAVPFKDIMKVTMTLKEHTFRSVDDGFFYPKGLMKKFANGDFAREFKKRGCRIIIGECRDEETVYRETNPPKTLSDLPVEVGNYYHPRVVDPLISLFQNDHIKDSSAHTDPNPHISNLKKLFGDIISDGQIRAPERLMVKQLYDAGSGLGQIMRYRIDWRAGFTDKKYDKTWGIGHAFDTPLWNFDLQLGPSKSDESIMRAWIKDLCDFVQLKPINYGPTSLKQYKVLTADGKITVMDDKSWEYCLKVADVMARSGGVKQTAVGGAKWNLRRLYDA